MGQSHGNIEEELRSAVQDLGTAKPGRKKGPTPMTRYRLSKLSGVSQAQLMQFARGNRTLTLKSAAKLAEVLGLELTPKRKGR